MNEIKPTAYVVFSFMFQLFGKIALDQSTEINTKNNFRNLAQALQVLFRWELDFFFFWFLWKQDKKLKC